MLLGKGILLGKSLLFAGCTALGVGVGFGLKQRTACLRDFRRAVQLLQRELAFSLRTLPELFAQLSGEGSVGCFVSVCQAEFSMSGGESWAESWEAALKKTALPLKAEDIAILRELGDVLGRYDSGRQGEALSRVLQRLDEAVSDALEEEKRLFRVYITLGITAGLFCLILLGNTALV